VSSAYTVSLSLKHNKILLYKYKAPVGFIDDGVVNLFDQLSFLKEDIEALGITVLPYSLSDFMK
jgi:hypothetical protein